MVATVGEGSVAKTGALCSQRPHRLHCMGRRSCHKRNGSMKAECRDRLPHTQEVRGGESLRTHQYFQRLAMPSSLW